MPWKDTCVEEQRMKFMAAYLEEDSDWSMSELCEVFGVSRKSGYKWLERYRDSGLDGLKDRLRAPLRHLTIVVPSALSATLRTAPLWARSTRCSPRPTPATVRS